MGVEITPAAHPVGTSVEVNDLFFNTPARRRFLRTEKTEFNHIDELIKRFALSRFDVEFVLKHNQKMLRNLKVASTTAQQERRVAAICGQKFIDNVVAINNEHNDIKISGWLGLPQVCRNSTDTQFCYVNGRMMRDKLINHAIRQAYQDWLPDGCVPSYVLYIELNPSQVDVNVHPSKHEVRFHQSRMIHDLIHQVLSSGLAQAMNLTGQSAPIVTQQVNHQYAPVETSTTPVSFDDLRSNTNDSEVRNPTPMQNYQPQYTPSHSSREIKQGASVYNNLLATHVEFETPISHGESLSIVNNENDHAIVDDLFGLPIEIIEANYLLLNHQGNIELLDLNKLSSWVESRFLQARWQQGFTSQPLLLPVSIKLDEVLLEHLSQNEQLFRRLGIDITVRRPQIIVKQVPQILRNQDIATLIPQLLTKLEQQQYLDDSELTVLICDWLATMTQTSYTLLQATQLLTRAKEFHDELIECRNNFVVCVDFSETLAAFNKQ